AGAPEPLLQAPVVDADGRRRRLDLAWPERSLDVETDGDRWHLNPADRRAMTDRDRALAAAGTKTLRFSSSDLELDLTACVATVLRQLGLRG
ncbi:MAG: endonuclease domain-containing protein, partial [Actinomycetota bacterium]|nr:endonuclease domain-containing protein [Actinomycetota bacterium]